MADLIAQEWWEERAAQAYDAYHAHGQGPREVLTEDELFQSLRDQPEVAAGEAGGMIATAAAPPWGARSSGTLASTERESSHGG